MEVAFLHFITFKTNRREASRSCNGRPKYLKYFFQHNWKEIDGTYNYLVGLDCNYRDAELSRLENSLLRLSILQEFISHGIPIVVLDFGNFGGLIEI